MGRPIDATEFGALVGLLSTGVVVLGWGLLARALREPVQSRRQRGAFVLRARRPP